MAEDLIVVPLDGSELSERAIPYATLFAKTFGGRLLLITVWEGAEDALVRALPGMKEALFKTGEEYFEQYLAAIASKCSEDGVRADAEVLTGTPADVILKLVGDRKAGLLAFATHGRSGLSRWWSGSTANELAQHAKLPRLIIGPKVLSQPARAIKVDGVVVPVDGSDFAECAVDEGARIAKQFGATLHIVEAISPTAQTFMFDMPAVATADITRQIEEGSKEYLAGLAERAGAGAKTAVLRGPPADVLVDYVEAQGIDLVVMATHGLGGLMRVALGSVADRMLQSDAPVYLVPPPAKLD